MNSVTKPCHTTKGTAPSCNDNVVGQELCRQHGGKSQCIAPDCTTKPVKRGLCIKHGAHGKCSAPDCTTNALSRGLCLKHGAKGVCPASGCTAYIVSRGVCAAHGVKPTCTVPGCTTNANVRGLCHTHGEEGACTVPGCVTTCINQGFCTTHGAKVGCSAPGCTTNAIKRGLCHKHGAHGSCTIPDCTSNATSSNGGLCAKHGGPTSALAVAISEAEKADGSVVQVGVVPSSKRQPKAQPNAAFLEKDVYYAPDDVSALAKSTYMSVLGLTDPDTSQSIQQQWQHDVVKHANFSSGRTRRLMSGAGRFNGSGIRGDGEGGARKGYFVDSEAVDSHDDQCHKCSKASVNCFVSKSRLPSLKYAHGTDRF
jgi:hypothetical protein